MNELTQTKTMNIIAVVKNAPSVIEKGYVVARAFNGDLWFWGNFTEVEKAYDAAEELENAVVLYVEENTNTGVNA